MRNRILSLATVLFVALAGGLVQAHEYKVGDIEVLHPWTRATPPNAETAGGYLKLRNDGQVADALIGGHSTIAERVEIHSMTTEDGVMRMRPVGKDGVVVKPGETVALAPGGIHIMFVGLKNPLKAGERVPLTLEFKNGGSLDVELATEELGSRGPEGGMPDHGMEHSQ